MVSATLSVPFVFQLWLCPHTQFLSLSYDLRNSCSICSICHWSHESFHNFVCSQDDFASFANTEGGNYPSRISKTASETRWGFYWTIWMAWQGVNKTAANWSCQQQQQQQQERDDDSSNSSSSYAITRWLQHDVVAATCCQPAAVAAAACRSWAITASKHF